jgi:MFS family permease
VSLCINYIDRGNIATAGPLIIHDLSLSATAFGSLAGAFYLTYTLAQWPAGWFADRYGAKSGFMIGIGLWSLSTFLTGFATGFGPLLLLRLVLGIGESVAYPSTAKLIAEHVPPTRLGIANSVTNIGFLVGPAIGTLAGAYLMVHMTWRFTFFVFGIISLLWLIPWSRLRLPEITTRGAAGQREAVPSTVQLLRKRALWGGALGHFSANYTFYFILTWLPTYLMGARGFTMGQMASVASSAYLLNAAATLFAGWAIDRWVTRGGSVTFAHKLPLGVAHLVGIGCMIGLAVLPLKAALACLYAYELFLGFAAPSVFAVPQIFAGPTAAARWLGIQNMFGNLPGMIGGPLTGLLVDAAGGSYLSAFVLAGAINLAGFLGWVVILPKIKPVDWANHALTARVHESCS